MDGTSEDKQSLLVRIQQVENERDELRKDIEQLCMQQAGPSYLAVATRMHFQRTTALEQEIENLKKKLAACTREKINFQEELSEAYRIKSQLADLHGIEVAKNLEAEKQVKFFQGCVAAAFAERDHSTMEAEKAKEKEEVISEKLTEVENRFEELTSSCLEQKKRNDTLQFDLAKLQEQNESLKKVVEKFYEIRQNSLEECEDLMLDDKCACLLQDPVETWTFNDPSTSEYVSALEEELEKARSSVENLKSKLRVGLEIENHLKRKVRELEKKNILSENMIMSRIADLHQYYAQQRVQILNILVDGASHIQSTVDALEERVKQHDVSIKQNMEHPQHDECECRDVHITTDTEPNLEYTRDGPSLPHKMSDQKGDASEALSQALQEKVDALFLLSQQEERHLLERNVNAALQKKIEELHRNLLQVTNEKVKALVELARLKQEYQLLQEKTSDEAKDGKSEIGERRVIIQERDGRLKNLLKKTYLKRWIGPLDIASNEAAGDMNAEGNFFGRRSSSMDYARMRIESATLRESMEVMEHLITSIHRIRLSLLKVRESVTSEGTASCTSETLNDIISEANLVKIALGSSLPVSWSAATDNEAGDVDKDSSSEKIDSVSAAGFEMVELLILAAQTLKDTTSKRLS